ARRARRCEARSPRSSRFLARGSPPRLLPGPGPLHAVLGGERRLGLRGPRRRLDACRREEPRRGDRQRPPEPRRLPAPRGTVFGIALGLASSVAWGVSDFLGGLTTRRASALSVLIVSQPIGLVLALVVAVASGGGLGWPGRARRAGLRHLLPRPRPREPAEPGLDDRLRSNRRRRCPPRRRAGHAPRIPAAARPLARPPRDRRLRRPRQLPVRG